MTVQVAIYAPIGIYGFLLSHLGYDFTDGTYWALLLLTIAHGGAMAWHAGRTLDGREHSEYPG